LSLTDKLFDIFKVSRTDKGVIHDHRKPLMGILQQSVTITPLKRFEPSRAVLDLIDNMRSKIYGFFCKLGFSELPGLHEEDFVTLCIIENFLDFKMGEIWQEIMTELEMENVKLIPPDSEATDTILRATEERALGRKRIKKIRNLIFVFSCGCNAKLCIRTISETRFTIRKRVLSRCKI
jgi:hypothetical protein